MWVDDIRNEGDNLKLSLSNTVLSNYPLEENLVYAKKLGFENIEFNMRTVEQGDEKSVYRIKKMLAIQGLNCLTLHAATFPVTDKLEIPKAVYYGKVSVNFANMLSAPVMVVHSNVSRELPENQRKRFLHLIFKEIRSHAKKLNIRLSLENLSYQSKSYGKDTIEIEHILNIVDDGTIEITLDFCHGETTGQTMNLFEKYKNKISNIHISNQKHGTLEPETPNLKEFLRKLQDYGYTGPLTIELNSTTDLKQILKTKSVLENILKKEQ